MIFSTKFYVYGIVYCLLASMLSAAVVLQTTDADKITEKIPLFDLKLPENPKILDFLYLIFALPWKAFISLINLITFNIEGIPSIIRIFINIPFLIFASIFIIDIVLTFIKAIGEWIPFT